MKLLSFLETSKIPKNETPSICKSCGACCKGQPGGYAPDQFETEQQIMSLVRSNQAIFDYWIADIGGHVYFLRPRKGDETGVEAPWNMLHLKKPCVNLTEKGCSLKWSDRPHGCRTLKAFMKDGERACEGMYIEDGKPVNTKKILAYEWQSSKFDLYEMLSNLQDELYG